jgi:hypothetical protein
MAQAESKGLGIFEVRNFLISISKIVDQAQCGSKIRNESMLDEKAASPKSVKMY